MTMDDLGLDPTKLAEAWVDPDRGGSRRGDEREVERLASIVPGFPKAEALQKPKRARKPPKSRPK